MTAPALLALPPAELLAGPPRTATDVAARFLLGYGPNTRDAYRRDLEQFGAWCAQQDLDPLAASRAHVELYARGLEAAGRARSSVRRAMAALSGFYRYALDEDLVARNPLASVRRPQVDDDTLELGLKRSEIEAFLAVGSALGGREAVVAQLLVYNGLRASEIASARVEDLGVQQGHRVLTITRKGGRRATVPLAASTAAAVDGYLDGRTTGPLVLARDGGPSTRHVVAHIVERLATRARIGKATPHTLRHGFVTESLEAGVPLQDVQDAAGHRDPRTTQRYNRRRHSLPRHPAYALAARYAEA